jgi:hypothetical protein
LHIDREIRVRRVSAENTNDRHKSTPLPKNQHKKKTQMIVTRALALPKNQHKKKTQMIVTRAVALPTNFGQAGFQHHFIVSNHLDGAARVVVKLVAHEEH